jgi:hypothetical protein
MNRRDWIAVAAASLAAVLFAAVGLWLLSRPRAGSFTTARTKLKEPPPPGPKGPPPPLDKGQNPGPENKPPPPKPVPDKDAHLLEAFIGEPLPPPSTAWLPDSSGLLLSASEVDRSGLFQKTITGIYLHDVRSGKARNILSTTPLGPPILHPSGNSFFTQQVQNVIESPTSRKHWLSVGEYSFDGMPAGKPIPTLPLEKTIVFGSLTKSSPGLACLPSPARLWYARHELAFNSTKWAPARPQYYPLAFGHRLSPKDGKGHICFERTDEEAHFPYRMTCVDPEGKRHPLPPLRELIPRDLPLEDRVLRGSMIMSPQLHASYWEGPTAVVEWARAGKGHRLRIDTSRATAAFEMFEPRRDHEKRVIHFEHTFPGGGRLRLVEVAPRKLELLTKGGRETEALGQVRLDNVPKDGAPVQAVYPPCEVIYLDLSPDGRHLLAYDPPGQVRKLISADGKVTDLLPSP